MLSKTAGYHRHFFRFPIFVKKAFKKTKTFFFENTVSSSYFLNFQTFCRKNLIFISYGNNKVEKIFSRNDNIWYASTVKLPHLASLKKNQAFWKKNFIAIFPKQKQILNALRNLTISTAFYGKFATICRKNVSRSESVQLIRLSDTRNWQTVSKKTFAVSGWLSSLTMNLAENNKKYETYFQCLWYLAKLIMRSTCSAWKRLKLLDIRVEIIHVFEEEWKSFIPWKSLVNRPNHFKTSHRN